MSIGVITIQYFAGLFDGEGCINIVRCSPNYIGSSSKSHAYRLNLSVGMTDPRPIKAFKTFFNGTRMIVNEQPNTTRQRAMYRFQCSNVQAEKIIKKLLPYLICKKEQAEEALNFREYMRESSCLGKIGFAKKPVPKHILEKRHSFYLKLRELKAPQFQH